MGAVKLSLERTATTISLLAEGVTEAVALVPVVAPPVLVWSRDDVWATPETGKA
jgi:hypothetical protein